MSEDWLNEKHISGANSILKNQFPKINGMPETSWIPHLADSQGNWAFHKILKIKMHRQVKSVSQVLSFQLHQNNGVNYVDRSITYKSASNNWLIQMSQTLKSKSRSISLKFSNSKIRMQWYFAIAHMVKFCLSTICYNPCKCAFADSLQTTH